MTPERSPLGPLVDFLRSLPGLTLLLLAIPFAAPSLTEWLVAPLLPLVRPVVSGDHPDTPEIRQELAALRQDNERLRRELAETGRMTGDRSPATGILVRNLGQSPQLFHHSLIIDAGSRDGVSRDAPALHRGALVGFVDDHRAHWSRVVLLADPDLRVAVEVVAADNRPAPAEGWVRGLAGGRSPARGDGAVMLHHIPTARRADIRVGDMVVTSGRDFRAAPGWLVGQIKSIKRGDLFLEVEISTEDPRLKPLFRLLPPSENPFESGDG